MSAQDTNVALPMRSHTIFGVCEGIGEDFGFNPVWLRVPFAASVLISPTYAILAYFALGLVVMASRLLFPKVNADTPVAVAEARSASNANDPSGENLKIAA